MKCIEWTGRKLFSGMTLVWCTGCTSMCTILMCYKLPHHPFAKKFAYFWFLILMSVTLKARVVEDIIREQVTIYDTSICT